MKVIGAGREENDRGGMQPLLYRRSVGFEVPSSGRECRCFICLRGPRGEKKAGRYPRGPGESGERKRKDRRASRQITSNKRVSRFVSAVFNTDKQIERIFITFPGHSGPNNYRLHRIFVPGMPAGPVGDPLSHFRGSCKKKKTLIFVSGK